MERRKFVSATALGGAALGAALAGFAGTLFATLMSAVSPGAFVFTESVTLFAIVLVGGQGSIPGVLLGTVLMFVVPQVFRGFAEYRYFVFGIAIATMCPTSPTWRRIAGTTVPSRWPT